MKKRKTSGLIHMLFNNRPDDLNETSVFKIVRIQHLAKNGKFNNVEKNFNIQYYRNQNPISNYRTPIQDIYLRHNELIGIANCLGRATCPRLKGH